MRDGPIEPGVLCTGCQDVFMGEFDVRRVSEYAVLARSDGWRRTVEERVARQDPGAQMILLSPDRANFLDLLGSPRTASYSTWDAAWALPASSWRSRLLAFIRLTRPSRDSHSYQESVAATRPICHRDVLHLPFSSLARRMPVMVGVFETAPRLAYFCELAGRWLRQFHRIERLMNAAELRPSLTRYYAARIDELARNPRSRVSKRLVDVLLRSIQNWLDQALDGLQLISRSATTTFLPTTSLQPRNGSAFWIFCSLTWASSSSMLRASGTSWRISRSHGFDPAGTSACCKSDSSPATVTILTGRGLRPSWGSRDLS